MSTSPAAGWYADTTQPNTLRWWDGTAWTADRSPMPPAANAEPFEMQAPVAPAVQPSNAPWSPGTMLTKAKEAASDPSNQATGMTLAGAALAADGVIGFGRNRAGIGGAIKAILLGVAFAILANIAVGALADAGSLHAGEVETVAVVTDLGSQTSTTRDTKGVTKTTTQCYPVAEFTVGEKTYTAVSTLGQSPCPVRVNDKATVFYDPDSIQETARMKPDATLMALLKFAPLLGVAVALGGLWTFIKRAGSLAGGIVLIRKGLKGRRAAEAQSDDD